MQCQAVYTDKTGRFPTVLWNDGHKLTLEIRNVIFSGQDFDDLVPPTSTPLQKLHSFAFSEPGHTLCDCTIECQAPMKLFHENTLFDIILGIRVILGKPRPLPRGGIETLTLSLHFFGLNKEFQSEGKSGDFESELISIQKQLSPGTYLKCCFTCAYSDYSPVGQGLLGYMLCFRDAKDCYSRANTKEDFFALAEVVTEYVQEIYLCPQFLRRKPGTGYRG